MCATADPGGHSRASVGEVSAAPSNGHVAVPVESFDKTETDRTSHHAVSCELDRPARRRRSSPWPTRAVWPGQRLVAGVAIHGETRAVHLARESNRWVVTTQREARVTADRVVMCTNAYADDLWPGLRRTVIAPNSYQIATEPLSDNIRKSILPFGQVSSDARKLLLYFRLDDRGRFLLGGRGPFREPRDAGDWQHLEAMLPRLFPQLKGARIEYRWCGRVSITRDFLPHLHEPAPGLLIDIGCMGRGVALQTALGQAMADYIASGNTDALPLPCSRQASAFQASQAYFAAAVAWYRFLDRRGISDTV